MSNLWQNISGGHWGQSKALSCPIHEEVEACEVETVAHLRKQLKQLETVSHRLLVGAELEVPLTPARRPNVLVQVPKTTAYTLQMGRLGKDNKYNDQRKRPGGKWSLLALHLLQVPPSKHYCQWKSWSQSTDLCAGHIRRQEAGDSPRCRIQKQKQLRGKRIRPLHRLRLECISNPVVSDALQNYNKLDKSIALIIFSIQSLSTITWGKS